MKPLALVAVFLALASPAAATELIPLGEIGYGGTGCPNGSAEVLTTDGRTSALLKLSSYGAGDSGRSIDRKSCALAVPISVPDGVAVAIRSVVLFGSADLPAGIEAKVNLEAFVAGDAGEVQELTLAGPRSGTWYKSIVIFFDDMVWTGCGQDSILRVNTSLRAPGNENAKATVDALALYRLATKAC